MSLGVVLDAAEVVAYLRALGEMHEHAADDGAPGADSAAEALLRAADDIESGAWRETQWVDE